MTGASGARRRRRKNSFSMRLIPDWKSPGNGDAIDPEAMKGVKGALDSIYAGNP